MTPDTPLDAVIDAIDTEVEQNRRTAGMGYTPAEMLDEGTAATFTFTLYGEEFTVLTWIRQSNFKGRGISAVLYEEDIEMDETVRNTDYLAVRHLYPGELADDEAAEDTAHQLATCLGYFTRYLLDGRDYEWYSRNHSDPAIDAEVKPDEATL